MLSMKSVAMKLAMAAAALAVAGTAVAASYSIGPGDLLSIYVYRQEDMNMKVRVDNGGYIRFPLAGRIQVTNKRPEQIESVIASALRRGGFASPEVVVSVDTFAPRRVYVLGEVDAHSDLSCTIPEGGEMTAMQAISMVGGLKDSSDISGIVVRRASGTIHVPASQILSGGNVQDIVLQPFDTVVVPKAKPVSVLGTVKKSGEFYASPANPLTVSRAIALAGGAERPKSLSEIRVMRGSKFFEVDVQSLLEKGKGEGDMKLQPGDVVYVPETRW